MKMILMVEIFPAGYESEKSVIITVVFMLSNTIENIIGLLKIMMVIIGKGYRNLYMMNALNLVNLRMIKENKMISELRYNVGDDDEMEVSECNESNCDSVHAIEDMHLDKWTRTDGKVVRDYYCDAHKNSIEEANA